MTSAARASAPVLLADIGGTNARFILATGAGPLPTPVVLKTADYASLGDALKAFLGVAPPTLAAAAFSVAGPVENSAVRMTNCPWVVSAPAITAASGVGAPLLLNDFAALGHGLAALQPADLRMIGPGRVDPARGPLALIGPGTGLGVGALIPDGKGGFLALSSEGGHADLAPGTPRELAVLAHLLTRHAHVSAERVLSGPGLVTLYDSLAEIDGAQAQTLSAAQIDQAALAGNDPRAVETIRLFTGLLASMAGNLALTLGAKGGVLLGGGILPRWGALFDDALFRARFTAKGRFADYLAAIPTAIILAPDIAFRGLYRLAAATLTPRRK
jgi:glucokinase